ncbi:MAG: PKD domain-containing protein [Syntrophobacteria bacterium]
MRSFICYLGILSMMIISPPLAVNIGADESTDKTDAEIVCDFIAKPVHGPSPLTVTFQDHSTGKITHWYWKFGEDSKSRRRHPVHEYLKAGQYSVSLTVKGPAGISELARGDYIKVIAKP